MIFSKWLRSLRFGNEYFKLIDSDSYYHSYHIYINQLLQRPSVFVHLAVLSDDHDVVLGFSVMELGVLHYVHVHKDQRKQGIGTNLAKDFHTITHLTHIGVSIWNKKYPKVRFNPFY